MFRAPVGFLLCTILCLCVNPSPAATILEIELQQLVFEDPVAMDGTGPTNIGRLDLIYEAGPEVMFLNLRGRLPGETGEGFWLVRNLLLHGQPTEVPIEQLARRMPLQEIGLANGELVAGLEFAMTLQPTPLLDADYPDWAAMNPIDQFLPATLYQVTIATEPTIDATLGPSVADPSWWRTYSLPASWLIVSQPGCSMPNIDLDGSDPNQPLDINACVPASCANSLQWLKSRHPEIQFPGSLRDTFTELSKLMDRTQAKGVDPQVAARAKLDFAEAHGLPIHVKYQDRYGTGDVSSTTGQSTASDMGSPNAFPTKAWLQAEADAGEDIEVNVSWAYTDSGKVKWDGSHALVLSGMGETAGQTWIKLKHDNNQHRGGNSDLKQEESNVHVNPEGAMWLPGLTRKVKRGDGTEVDANAFVTSVISESFDPFVFPPPGTETFGGYCDLIKRTIPPLGSIDVSWPNDEARCYNATVWALDRETDPPTLRQQQNWNHNRGSTKTWVNTSDYPVTVFIHNDDWQAGEPYPGFDVGVNVHQGPTTGLPTPGNPLVYGGFSIAGRDGSTVGFNPQANGIAFADIGPVQEGLALVMVPTVLDDLVGPRDWRLWTDIPAWNDYWGHLGLVLDVLAVAAPGNVQVVCPNNGFAAAIPVAGPGRFFLDLGPLDPAPAFEIILTAGPGLSITIDSIGIPSLVTYHGTDAPPDRASQGFFVRAWPNPFNPRTEIQWNLDREGEVELRILDVRGRIVRAYPPQWHPAGPGHEIWDGIDGRGDPVASGVYLVQVIAGERSVTTKVSLVR